MPPLGPLLDRLDSWRRRRQLGRIRANLARLGQPLDDVPDADLANAAERWAHLQRWRRFRAMPKREAAEAFARIARGSPPFSPCRTAGRAVGWQRGSSGIRVRESPGAQDAGYGGEL